jgi:hypothetical protein
MGFINTNYKCNEEDCKEKVICIINGIAYCERHSVVHRNRPGIRIQWIAQPKNKNPRK